MKLKIRTKVTLGILFLFLELSVIAVMTIYFLSSINNRTELMIKNNYQSVQFSENMVQVIEEIHASVTSACLNKLHHVDKSSLEFSFKKFEENLKNEEANITEFGEKELVQSIHQKYYKYKTMISSQNVLSESDKSNFYFVNISPLFGELKTAVFAVSNLNMQAIIHKNENLNTTISDIYKKLTGALALCFLITFSFMLNFPNYIARPIKQITENIKAIANKNYKSEINFSSKDEIEQLSEAFKFMAEKLEESQQQIKPVPAPQIKKDVVTVNEEQVLENIQKLLGTVTALMESLPKSENSDQLQIQSKALRDVEAGLKGMIK